jgi:hypothetical protein
VRNCMKNYELIEKYQNILQEQRLILTDAFVMMRSQLRRKMKIV